MVSAKLLGVGLLGMGCLTAVSAAGYLALRPTERSIPQGTIVQAPKDTPVVVEPIRTAESVALDSPYVVSAPKSAPPAPKAQTSGRTQPEARADTKIEPTPDPPALQAPVAPPPAPAPVEAPLPAQPAAAVDPPRHVPESPGPPVQAPEATKTIEPAVIEFQELTVEKQSVIGIRLETSVSTRTARVEDRVSATVTRDVTVGGRTAIAEGVRLEGIVTVVERGGRFKNRPRLGLRFERMILADGTRVSIKTDTIYREGDSPTADSTAKVGAAAAAGAILGAVLGGKKGAAIGTAAGAAGGAAAVMRAEPGEITLPTGAPLTVRLAEDVTVAIRK